MMQISVKTDHPIAADSLDHTYPRGAALDNSRNRRFNWKLYGLYAALDRPMRVLDLGCAGGGFVRDCLYDGRLAVGIEGSDYSSNWGRAEWPLLGGRYLFTADITRPFAVVTGEPASGERMLFDVVSLWEVLEHITERDLPAVFQNIRAHLAPGGLVIASISSEPVRHHQTVQDRAWWAATFRAQGLVPAGEYVGYFSTQFIRGPKYGAAGSFHVIATNDATRAPTVPPTRVLSGVLDRFWFGSRLYRQIRHLLGIES
jgi:SAM-dependent methyltransferase